MFQLNLLITRKFSMQNTFSIVNYLTSKRSTGSPQSNVWKATITTIKKTMFSYYLILVMLWWQRAVAVKMMAAQRWQHVNRARGVDK